MTICVGRIAKMAMQGNKIKWSFHENASNINKSYICVHLLIAILQNSRKTVQHYEGCHMIEKSQGNLNKLLRSVIIREFRELSGEFEKIGKYQGIVSEFRRKSFYSLFLYIN